MRGMRVSEVGCAGGVALVMGYGFVWCGDGIEVGGCGPHDAWGCDLGMDGDSDGFSMGVVYFYRVGEGCGLREVCEAGCQVKKAGRCVVCGEISGILHHLLPKSVYPEHRNEPMNLVFVCAWHHTMAGDVCAHGMDSDSRAAFNDHVRLKLPDSYAWWAANSRRKIEHLRQEWRTEGRTACGEG